MTVEPAERGLFNTRLVVGLVLASVAAFIGFLLVATYAPQFRGSSDGRAHALSRGGTGFAGIVKLLQLQGDRAQVVRDELDLERDGLVVVMLDPGQDKAALEIMVEGRTGAVLYVLPKWQTTPHQTMPGWVNSVGGQDPAAIALLAEPVHALEVEQHPADKPGKLRGTDVLEGLSMPAPAYLQTLKGKGLEPILLTADGRMVLAAVGSSSSYILADPDLLNNQALRTQAGARHAVALLDGLNDAPEQPILFDATVNGFAVKRSLLRLMFEPPFVALTLVLAVAGALAAWQAAVRFGPALAAPRAIALGSGALVDNMAGLLAMARREHLAGPGYAELLAVQAGHSMGAPAGLAGADLEAWLDRRSNPASGLYSTHAEALRTATDSAGLLAAAQSLFHWKKDLTGR